MALKIQAAFGAGELDPALHERTNLEKYQTGLATARNVYIGKTGRIISRPGTKYVATAKYSNRACIVWAVPGTDVYLEWGHQYVRVHDYSTTTYTEIAHTMTDAQLYGLQFEYNDGCVFIFWENSDYLVLDINNLAFLNSAQKIKQPTGPYGWSVVTATGTGYDVVYTATLVGDGIESVVSSLNSNQALPISTAEVNDMRVSVRKVDYPNLSDIGDRYHCRVYRRPVYGSYSSNQLTQDNDSAPGFIAIAFYESSDANYWYFRFKDHGQAANYAITPPIMNLDFYQDSYTGGSFNAKPKTGCFYQQKLCISGRLTKNALFTSRTKHWYNFTRDYPLSDVSALAMRLSGLDNHSIIRLADIGGLTAFTTGGIYQSVRGSLGTANLGLDKKGDWVIDEILSPLKIPGAILINDSISNSIMALNYSDATLNFEGNNISVFSQHLIKDRTILSWDIERGVQDIIWCVLDNGQMVSLSYNKEHQLQAWTRHDTDGEFLSVTSLTERAEWSVGLSTRTHRTLVTVKRDNGYYIEELANRWHTKPLYYTSNDRGLDLKHFIGMDSAVVTENIIGFEYHSFTVNPDTPGDWDGTLTLTASSALAFSNAANNGAVGSIFRFFDSDGFAIDLTVTTYTSTTVVKVTPSSTFPSSEAAFTYGRLYGTFATVTGLSHLNGKDVSVMVDGYIVGSPLNDVEDYDTYTVSGGSITLANGLRGAVIIVGLPYACDVETLDIDTVEQKPLLLESRLASRIHLKVHSSRGLFAGSSFPEDDLNTGMEDIEQRVLESDTDLLGNSAQQPYTRRIELTVPGDWKSNGRVCLRQVDPLPFEILSIIPDLEVYRR